MIDTGEGLGLAIDPSIFLALLCASLTALLAGLSVWLCKRDSVSDYVEDSVSGFPGCGRNSNKR